MQDEKEWGLENSHMCNLKKGTLRSLKIIGGGGEHMFLSN